ncbi:MAG: CYTH and CHAD domain-containing protein [Pseudomonadota bacterium]
MKSEHEEIEFKAGLDPEALATLRKHAALRPHTVGRATTRVLRSIYFDTPSGRLRDAGLSLRLRRTGHGWTQTLKASRRTKDGLQRVYELNSDAAAPVPNLDAVPDAAWRKRLRKALKGKPLKPVFETRVRRTSRLLASDQGEVELAIDTGRIVSGEAEAPVSEIELELKSGETDAVFDWARDLLGDQPARLEQPSKADRGAALFSGDAPSPPSAIRTSASPVRGDASAGEAVAALLGFYAAAIARNLHLTLSRDDPEGPHQLRVALRRLRVLCAASRGVMRSSVRRSLQRRARRLGRIVAPLRDVDVMTDEIFAPEIADDAAGERLLEALNTWREKTRATVRADLLSVRATAFAIDLHALAASGGWRRRSRRGRRRLDAPARDLAARALEGAWRICALHGERFKDLSVSERHRLRKDLKALRYAADAFAPAFDGEPPQAFVRAVRRLQNKLGQLNDLAMLETFDPQLERVLRPAFDTLRERLVKDCAVRTEAAMDQAIDRWDALTRAPRYWA